MSPSGAFAYSLECIRGPPSPGNRVDFAELRKDPRNVLPDTIKDIVVDATYVGGANVWQQPKNALAVIHHMAPGIDFDDDDEDGNTHHDQNDR